ncbi:MAG: adenosylcobinamide-GDP ribazoletransferase [Pseudomonadota bacterium]
MTDMFRNLPADTLASLRFLSRLPIPYSNETPLPDFRRQAHTFPLAGLLIAIPAAIITALSIAIGLPDAVIALLTIATTAIVTGALHEDGLADVADGFWGGHTRDRKLQIMRDSSIGSYGMLALILKVGLTAAAMTGALSTYSPATFCIALAAATALSRATMLWPWVTLENARPSSGKDDAGTKNEAGLSARFGLPDRTTLKGTLVLSLLPTALLLSATDLSTTIITLLAMALTTFALTRIANHHIGGHTGDVLGATQQITFLVFWIALLATT